MRAAAALLALAIGALAFCCSPHAAAAGPVFYELPPATHARSMTAGPEGAIWFSGERASTASTTGAAVVGRIDQSGASAIFDLPPGRSAGKIAAGPDGNLWFAETFANKRGNLVARIGRMTPTGEFTEWRLGNHVGGVEGVAAGPGDAIWFTAVYWVSGRKRATVGRIDGDGRVRRFPLPSNASPGNITAGPDGNLWFVEDGGGKGTIARLTPAGRITEFPLPGRGRVPNRIVVGAEGKLWFGEQTARYANNFRPRLGRISTSGRITEFHAPGAGYTAGLAPKPGGGVWYLGLLKAGPLGIGSAGPGGAAVAPVCVKVDPCDTDADALAVGPDGSLWFSASTYYAHNGGGGSGLMEGNEEAAEAGLIGRFAPGTAP